MLVNDNMKNSMFSTHELKYIWYLLKKVNFLFILYFLDDLQLINLLTMCFKPNHNNVKEDKGNVKEDKGVIYMIYSHQDFQIKRNLFSVKVRDK